MSNKLFNMINNMSEVRVMSNFKVCKDNYTVKNKNTVLSPSHLKTLMINDRELNLISPNQIKFQQKEFKNTSSEKLMLKCIKKTAVFKNELKLTNKLL